MALDLWQSKGNALTWMFGQSLRGRHVMIPGIDVDKKYKLESGLATQICESYFGKSIARIVLEVAQPTVLGVEKKEKVTFPDQLGTVGK